MNKNRPVNLDLRTIQLPVMAQASILHRLSGLFLFLSLPCLLYVLQLSLTSPEGFASVQQSLSTGISSLFWVLTLMALTYHLVAGIRHLIMDLGHGETLEGGRRGATLVLVFGIGLSVAVGVWAW